MLIDWCSATFTQIKKIDEIFFIIGVPKNNFEYEEKGVFGYTECYSYGHIKIYTNPKNPEMGYHIIMSGQGCREYEKIIAERDFDWSDFFDWAIKFKGKFTRLDVALDSFKDELNLARVLSCCKKGACVTRIKYLSEYRKIKLSDGSIYGRTLYFGSRSSDIMIRMYDKKQERLDKNYDVPFETWVRCELELKHDAANNFAMIIANGNDVGLVTRGILSNSLRFVKGTKDSIANARANNHQNDLPVCDWWEDFLQGVQPLKISKKATETDIEKSTDWFINSASKQMAKLEFLMGREYLDKVSKKGAKKISESELAELTYRKTHDTYLRDILNLKLS